MVKLMLQLLQILTYKLSGFFLFVHPVCSGKGPPTSFSIAVAIKRDFLWYTKALIVLSLILILQLCKSIDLSRVIFD